MQFWSFKTLILHILDQIQHILDLILRILDQIWHILEKYSLFFIARKQFLFEN